jgi:hypothetical protein
VPRAVFFDLESGVIGAVRASPLGELTHPGNFVNLNAGAGSNWAKGHLHKFWANIILHLYSVAVFVVNSEFHTGAHLSVRVCMTRVCSLNATRKWRGRSRAVCSSAVSAGYGGACAVFWAAGETRAEALGAAAPGETCAAESGSAAGPLPASAFMGRAAGGRMDRSCAAETSGAAEAASAAVCLMAASWRARASWNISATSARAP